MMMVMMMNVFRRSCVHACSLCAMPSVCETCRDGERDLPACVRQVLPGRCGPPAEPVGLCAGPAVHAVCPPGKALSERCTLRRSFFLSCVSFCLGERAVDEQECSKGR